MPLGNAPYSPRSNEPITVSLRTLVLELTSLFGVTAICKLATRTLSYSCRLPASYTMDQHPWAHGGSLWNPLALPHVPSCILMHLVTLYSHCHLLLSLAPNPVHHDSSIAPHSPHCPFSIVHVSLSPHVVCPLSLSSWCHIGPSS